MLDTDLAERKAGGRYLANIDDASHEKCEVVGYLGSIEGPVLEIGPGGGGALRRIAHIGRECRDKVTTAIALDNNISVLRRLDSLFDKEQDGNVQYVCADASEHLPFKENSIGAINGSSVVHEVFSYGGGFKGVETFFRECSRVLQLYGYLIYRDPTGADVQHTNTLLFRNEFAFFFVQFFLEKFLERNLIGYYRSLLFHQKRKVNTKKGRTERNRPVGNLSTFTNNVERDGGVVQGCRKISLQANEGLLREATRHFITFLDDIAPELIHQCAANKKTDSVRLTFAKTKGKEKFCAWLRERGISTEEGHDGSIDVPAKIYRQFIRMFRRRFHTLFRPLKISDITTSPDVLIEACLKHHVPIHEGNDSKVVFPSELSVKYEALNEEMASAGAKLDLPQFLKQACSWAAREGQEYYTYGSPSSVIATAMISSLQPDDSVKLGYSCLCPVNFDEAHFRLVERRKYSVFLQTQCDLSDIQERKQRRNAVLRDRKTVIHFQKVPLETAIGRLSAYVAVTNNPSLNQALDRLLFMAGKNTAGSQLFDAQFLRRVMCGAHDVFSLMDVERRKRASRKHTEERYSHIALAGSVASGKSTACNVLQRRGFSIISLSDFIREELERQKVVNPTQNDYFETARKLRGRYGHDVLMQCAVARVLKEHANGKFVVDGVRVPEEVDLLRSVFHDAVLMVIEAPEEVRMERVRARGRDIDASRAADTKRVFDLEQGIEPGGTNLREVVARADFVIDGSQPIVDMEKRIIQILEHGL